LLPGLAGQPQRPAFRLAAAAVRPLVVPAAHPCGARRWRPRGLTLVRFIRFTLGAIPIIPFNRKKQPLRAVRAVVWWPVSYAARSLIERFFAAAKRYCHLNRAYATGWDAVVLRVCSTHCAILIVALAAHQAGAAHLRLSPPGSRRITSRSGRRHDLCSSLL